MNASLNESASIKIISDTIYDEWVSKLIGLGLILASSFALGSMYLPIRIFKAGDGLFYQIMVGCGVWSAGFCVNLIRGTPHFDMVLFLGGILMSIGNIINIFSIKLIGIGMTFSFSKLIAMIVGIINTRFGLFGIDEFFPRNLSLNNIGIVLACLGAIVYLFIPVDLARFKNKHSLPIDIALHLDNGTLIMKRIAGLFLSFVSGLLYIESITPIIYTMQEWDKKYNKLNDTYKLLDYFFSFYCGFFINSLTVFVLYSIIKRNHPMVQPYLVLPGLISGWMLACGNICHFLALKAFSLSITFPLLASMPTLVALIWSVFLFKEMTALRCIAILITGLLLSISGFILVGLSI